jgi:hypothetical protein
MEKGPTNTTFTTSVGDETVTIDWPPDPPVYPRWRLRADVQRLAE